MSEIPTPERPNEQNGEPAEALTPPEVPDPQPFAAPPGPEQQAYSGYQPPAPDSQAYPDYSAYQQPPAPDAAADVPGYGQQPPAGYQQPQPYAQPGYPQPQGYGQPGYAQQPYPSYQAGVEQKSKVAAGILGILLGGFGIHNFYLGFTTKALIQLLVSVLSFGILYIFMEIWGLVEGILILTGSENFRRDARGIPLRD